MSEKCRLCGSISRYRFSLDILKRHKVGYFECEACGSLQTEKPYWLEEAYGIPGVHIDVGQAARVLQTWARLCFLLETIAFNKQGDCVDYGGSAGLLTRLMRDSGYIYFSFDKYDSSKYANYFTIAKLQDKRPRLVSAFEVFEHFPDPAKSLDEILTATPDLVVFSTQFYEGQDAQWDYLVPYCGQHIFFYREQALRTFCERYDYVLRRTPDFWILVRATSPYLDHIAASQNTIMKSAYVGDLFMRVGWVSEHTALDYSYAKERFQRELGISRIENKSVFKHLLRKAILSMLK